MGEHDVLQELLGAYVLDAVNDDESEAVEAHLAVCDDCAIETCALRAVVSRLGHPEPPPTPP